MYKLIVSDIDSTLINNQFKITEYNIEMIKRARKHGVDFMLSTGRLFGAARPYAKFLELDSPIITSNGGITMDSRTGETLFHTPISADKCMEIFNILDNLEVYYHFYSKNTFYTKKFLIKNSHIMLMNMKLPEGEQFPMLEVSNPSEVAKYDPVYKISVRCKNSDETKSFMQAFDGHDDIYITSSFADNYEISEKGVDKGSALQKYAKLKSINPDEILAFGDNFNDIQMIKFAGTGVAVANAVKELKDIADYITDTNENSGVGKAISRFIFNE
ncbi:MAG: HAD family phosphatase [Firmicutes bacterium]|nr:HAD family phosphatase [Bacillota bacterium]